MRTIKINASAVAALIGRNPYKSREEAISDLLVDNGIVREDLEAKRAVEELQAICEPESREVLAETACAAKLESAISAYEERLVDAVVRDAVVRKIAEVSAPVLAPVQVPAPVPRPAMSRPVAMPASIGAIIAQNVADGLGKGASAESITKKVVDQIPRESLKRVRVVAEAASAVVKKRGTIQEEASTNALQASTGAPVHSRNSQCYTYHMRGPDGLRAFIAGRVDGLQGNDTVVETKTRRRFWANVPEYDIVQLRCYMKLTKRRAGILNERFPNGDSRITNVEWSDAIWADIEAELLKVCASLGEH